MMQQPQQFFQEEKWPLTSFWTMQVSVAHESHEPPQHMLDNEEKFQFTLICSSSSVVSLFSH